jgi:ubiquinone/menaquinone biosynthesis C-methylase UbiE
VKSFAVPAEAYDRFMGVHSRQLAPQLADLARLSPGDRVLDIGCGPGALTTELVARLGTKSVAAVDPSESFVAATHERHPGVDVRRASAEALPFRDREFDAALAQLVVHFMTDPVAGLREMARVTRREGTVAACVWDHAGERTPVSTFFRAARDLGLEVQDESALAGAREGHLVELFKASGLRDVEPTVLVARVEYTNFDDWWKPFSFGVGPAGAAYVALDPDQKARLRERCEKLLPPAPFEMASFAWAARGIV